MPLTSDAVTKGCIVNNPDCKLISKCDECNKEIDDIIKIDAVLCEANPGINQRSPSVNQRSPSVKKRGRPKTIIKTDIKIIPGNFIITFK